MSDPVSEMNVRLVWFFGPSCAGKATLIQEVAADLKHPLSAHLALEAPVEVSAASLEVDGRADLGQNIRVQLRHGLTLLIKGQSSDISSPGRRVPMPVQLAADLSDSQHDVVFVWADPAELDRRALIRADQRPHERAYWLQHHGNSATELTWQVEWTRSLGMAMTLVRMDSRGISIGEGPIDTSSG